MLAVPDYFLPRRRGEIGSLGQTITNSTLLCVCLSVCLSHLTYGASVRPENAVTYPAGNEGKKVCGDLPETTACSTANRGVWPISGHAHYIA